MPSLAQQESLYVGSRTVSEGSGSGKLSLVDEHMPDTGERLYYRASDLTTLAR
jgi:hypothetical protein